MTDTDREGNAIGIKSVYDAVVRLDGKLEARVGTIETRIDRIEGRMDRNDGRLDMVKWLGPAGVAALIWGVARSIGLVH